MALIGLTSLIFCDFSQYTCEDTISPFKSCRIKSTVQLVLVNCFWIDDICFSLYFVCLLHGLHQQLPCFGLSATWWANHHKPMMQSLDLEQLQHLLNEFLFGQQECLAAYFRQVFSESRFQNGWDRWTWEDTSEECSQQWNIVCNQLWYNCLAYWS